MTGTPSEAFIERMLCNPDHFLLAAHGLQGLLSIVMVYFIADKAIRVRQRNDVLLAAAIAVLPLASIPQLSFGAFEYWNQNYLGFALGPLLSLLLWVRLHFDTSQSRLEVAGLGILAGVLGSIQLYYTTWIIGIAVSVGVFAGLKRWSLRRGLGAGCLAVGGGIAGFFVAFLPLLHRAREYSWWIRGLLTHQGANQTGPSGFTSIASLRQHFQGLWGQAPMPFIAAGVVMALVLTALVAMRGEAAPVPGFSALAAGLGLQLKFLIFIILKHPGPYYLLGVAATLPVLAAAAMDQLLQSGQKMRPVVSGAALLCLGVFVVGLVRSVAGHDRPLAWYEQAKVELQAIAAEQAARTGRDPDSLVIVWGYGSPSYCYGLRYGDIFTEFAFREEINELCPRDWSYDSWSQLITTPEGTFTFTGAEPWDMLIGPDQHLPPDAESLGEVRKLASGGLTVVLRRDSDSPAELGD